MQVVNQMRQNDIGETWNHLLGGGLNRCFGHHHPAPMCMTNLTTLRLALRTGACLCSCMCVYMCVYMCDWHGHVIDLASSPE
jgi:hypothetical protein